MDAASQRPDAVLAQLAQPSSSYKNSARLAVAGLLAFVVLYFGLASWFVYTAYRLTFMADPNAKSAGWGFFIALIALLLAVFMFKAIFAVRNAKYEGMMEVTAQQQPRLFAFLYELADAAGAPRPHRVYLSERVNAAVFYDLSLLNLFFPSKKNLEIGLALVNVLSLGELRAVLAHEFGHFAQRSMAVGRWVYLAQQITGHLVARRDKIDEFLEGLARIDLRVRMGVAVIQLIIWSIRALVESAFRVVVLMQRALSREMEMQADLVAVSLTGSDALVHALHKLQAADDAWERAAGFCFSEKAEGRPVRDVFAVQTHVLSRMGDILDDEKYGKSPELPQSLPELHRVFEAELAQPPRMWMTHPLNHEREANAKRVYVPMPINPTSAWSLFEAPQKLREQISTTLLGEADKEAPALEESLRKLGKMYRREQFKQRYCGMYFGRALTRGVAKPGQLRNPGHAAPLDDLALFYPETLKNLVRRRRALDSERGQLEALIAGVLKAENGVVRLRGEEFKLSQLPAALARVKQEQEEVNEQLQRHDLHCRSWHHSAAARLGGGWSEYLDGLLGMLHYAEHSEANLRDAHGLLRNTVAVVTAAGTKARSEEVTQVLVEANSVHDYLQRIYQQAPKLVLDEKLLERMEIPDGWVALLGEFRLPPASRENINEWMNAIGGWVEQTAGALNLLRSCALEQLLLTEILVAMHVRTQTAARAAPAPSQAPKEYPLLLQGDERERQTRLGWWARFQRADGYLPGAARLLVAGGIVSAMLGFGMQAGGSMDLVIYNGLWQTVSVSVDGKPVSVAGHGNTTLSMKAQHSYHIETRTMQGELIESFDTTPLGPGADGVYNVAGATPLVEWTAVYGGTSSPPDRMLHAPRWMASHADHLFSKPPQKGTGTRKVLEAIDSASPESQLQMLENDEERARVALVHARWDPLVATNTAGWLEIAARGGHPELLAARLRESPDSIPLLRIQQDLAQGKRDAAFCAPYEARAQRHPDSPDMKYIALRCRENSPEVAREWLAARAHWPDNPWLSLAASRVYLESSEPLKAIPALALVRRKLPQESDRISVEMARLFRLDGRDPDSIKLFADSPSVRELLALDRGDGPADSPRHAYSQLQRGEFIQALNATVGDEWQQAYVLRLIAASDGRPERFATRARALPANKGLAPATAWLNVAVAIKSGADPRPALEAAQAMFVNYPTVARFLLALQKGASPAAAEQQLGAVPLELRAYAYAAATVLLGPKTPQEWRQFSQRVLFANERPYFALK